MALCIAYLSSMVNFSDSLNKSPSLTTGGGHMTIIASPANLNISPPLLDIPYAKSSMYRFMQKAITSAPSFPILDRISVKFVNPLISANITTDLKR